MINHSTFHAIRFVPKKSILSAVIPAAPFAAGLYKLHRRILSGEREIYWSTCLSVLRIGAGDFFRAGVRGEENLCPWLQKVQWSQVG
jgi:hypothetical protein